MYGIQKQHGGRFYREINMDVDKNTKVDIVLPDNQRFLSILDPGRYCCLEYKSF